MENEVAVVKIKLLIMSYKKLIQGDVNNRYTI